MKIRNNLGSIITNSGGLSRPSSFSSKIGRVYHVISTRRSAGYKDDSDIGSVYVLDYKATNPNLDLSKEELTNDDLIRAKLKKVKPLFPQFTYVPLIGELVLLFDLPSKESTENLGSIELYYLNSIDVFLNTHHNSLGVYNTVNNETKLGEYTKESNKVANLIPLEGDLIISSRWGSGIRFSSTFDFNANIPQHSWETGGNTGDPITIITNGYNKPIESNDPYIENINSDDSSIYMTSTQAISNFSPNFIIDEKPSTFQPPLISPEKYYGKSQLILSSNRITLSSNIDDIVLYSATNIEAGSGRTIHLNAKENIYLNSENVYLGKIKDNSLKNPEPVLLGYKTKDLINNMLSNMIDFTEELQFVGTMPSEKVGDALVTISAKYNSKFTKLARKINDILSKVTYTS